MVRNDERASHVQQLRQLARTARVGEVKSKEASRAHVSAMVTRIRASQTSPSELQQLERVFKKYENTFPVAASTAAVPVCTDAKRIRGCSFLLTFNWNFFGFGRSSCEAQASQPSSVEATNTKPLQQQSVQAGGQELYERLAEGLHGSAP